MLMRDATKWPFRGLVRQYVSSTTHAYSVTCFQTFRQARRNFSNPPQPPKILNRFFQLLSCTCQWLTKKSCCSLPGFAVLQCFTFSHVWWADQPQKLSAWHSCYISVSKLIKLTQFSQRFVHNNKVIINFHIMWPRAATQNMFLSLVVLNDECGVFDCV